MIPIPQDSIFFIKLDYHSTCCYIPSWKGRMLGLLRLFILVHMFGRHFEWFSEGHGKIIDAPSLVDFNFAAATFCDTRCDKAACASFVAAICRIDNDFHMSHEGICCSHVSQRIVASCVSAFIMITTYAPQANGIIDWMMWKFQFDLNEAII